MARGMKDSGIEWIGVIPKHWPLMKMKYLVEFVQDKAQEQDSSKQYIALENIESWTGKYIETENTYGTEGALLCNKDDVIFGKLRPYLAKTMLINKDSVCSSEFAVMKGNGLIPRFLNYLARSDHFISVVNAGAYGTKMPRANIDQIGNLYFPVPPSFEQEMLSSFLDSKCAEIDKAIEATKASIDEFKKLRQAIITEAVTKGLDPDVEMKDSGIEWIGEIPKHWTTIKLKNTHDGMNVGESIDKEYWEESDGDIVFYTAGLKPITTTYRHFPPEKYTSSNDLLLARNGTPYVYLPIEKSVYTDHIIRVKIKDGYSKKYIMYCLQRSINAEIVDTVSIATWSASIWNRQCLPLPSYEEQKLIASFLDSKCSEIDSLIESKEKLIEELTAYRKSLIYEYVTGKKEVHAV